MWDLTTALKHSITQDKLTASSTYWLSQSPESSGLFKGSLGPGSALGEKRWKKSAWAKKKKKWRAKSAERYSGKGKGRRPFPLRRQPLGSLRSPIFFLFDPVFCLFPHYWAWSQANSKAIFTRLVGVTFIGAITEALTITRGKRDGVRWVGYLESFSIISLPGAPSPQISKFHFVKFWKINSTMWKYCWRGFIWMVTT